MNKIRWLILFFITLTAVLTVGNTFRLAQIAVAVENFEPVIIEQVVEPAIIPDSCSSCIKSDTISEPVSKPVRIDCPLDDDTQQMILDKCEEYNIDFAFTMAVIFKESSFRPSVVSYNGTSVGLMQINKINHEWLSEELGITDFFDPEQNVTAGLYMLRNLFEKYEDPALVLMAYNMGETGARKLWDKGIYLSDYAEGVLQQAEIYNQEIQERMGENDQV